MGMPSGCRERLPVTLADLPSGVWMEVEPLAIQPDPEGWISNSSRPMDWPSRTILNLPLSLTKTEFFLSAAFTERRRRTDKSRKAAGMFLERMVLAEGFLVGIGGV